LSQSNIDGFNNNTEGLLQLTTALPRLDLNIKEGGDRFYLPHSRLAVDCNQMWDRFYSTMKGVHCITEVPLITLQTYTPDRR
jgi:hypothetical protein